MRKILGKVKEYTNLIVNSEMIIIIIGILIFLKTIFFYKQTIYYNSNIQVEILQKTFIFSMFIVTFLFIFPNRARFIIGTILNLFISIVTFADNLYYNYSSSLISISQISNVQYSEQISVALKELFSVLQVLYFADIIIVLILILFRFIRIKKIKGRKYKPAIVYIAVMLVVYSSTIPTYITDAETIKYNKKMQIESGTLYAFHILDIKSNLDLKKTAKYKNKEEMMLAYNNLMSEYENNYEDSVYGLDGVAKDKNVIILQLESYQNFFINKTVNGQEITPNMNKFMHDNIQLNGMMSQSYSTTANSEHSTLTSLYPLENGMAFAHYSSNNYDDLYKLYKKAGYYTVYMHGNDGSFWNRNNVYGNMDVDELDFIENFNEDSLLINQWISDEELYVQGVDKLKEAENENGKFFATIVSASCHNAFDLPGLEDRSGRVNIDVGDRYRGTFFGNYLEAANYADYAFGLFIDELKKNDLYDNTVILVFGDHYALQMYNDEMLEFISDTEHQYNDVEAQINYINVSCGMRIPGIDHLELQKVISKLDIKPTLTSISGIEDGFSLGTNIFGTKDFVCLNNGIIVTENYYFNGDWYSISTGEKVDMNQISEGQKEKFDFYYKCMEEEISISNSVILNNLLN